MAMAGETFCDPRVSWARLDDAAKARGLWDSDYAYRLR
jgi:hypothetical protein